MTAAAGGVNSSSSAARTTPAAAAAGASYPAGGGGAVNVVMVGISTNITLNEAQQTVEVDGGVETASLLQWLGERGYTLPAITW